MDVATSPRWSKVTWLAVGLTVAILGVELALGGSSLLQALGQLRTPRWGWLALALLAEAASMAMYARMQRRLLRAAGTAVPLSQAVGLAYAAHSLSVTLPGGPAFSSAFNFRQMRRFGATSAVASWATAMSGVLSTAALAAVGALAAALAERTDGPAAVVSTVLPALAIGLFAQVLAQRPQWLLHPAVAGLGLLNRLLRRPPERGREAVQRFLEQLATVHVRPGDRLVASGFALANWAFDGLGFALACVAAGLHGNGITPDHLVVAYAAGMAASTISLVPGGLGVVDGALVLGLVAGGVHTRRAIGAVVLYRLISLGVIGAVGWLFWLTLRIRNRSTQRDPQESNVV
jgi:hypothetical protein